MTAAVPGPRFRDHLADALVEGVGKQMPPGLVWNLDKALDALMPAIAAEVEARVKAAADQRATIEAARKRDRAAIAAHRAALAQPAPQEPT